MRDPEPVTELAAIDERLAARLGTLRAERGWSLEELARRSGISRSTLSRLERAEISPTAVMLNRLCGVHERTMSRLLTEVEGEAPDLVRAGEQSSWTDPSSGFVRRSVSPPHAQLRGEVIEGVLPSGAEIDYDGPAVPGVEQHIWVLDGALEVTVQERRHELRRGDSLRFRLWGPSAFRCPGPESARYALVVVLP